MNDHQAISFLITFITVIVIVLLISLYKSLKAYIGKVTIYAYQKGLKYKDGKFEGILEPGVYWIFPRSTIIIAVDMRERFLSIASQEMLTKDAVTIKMSLAVQYAVADPDRAINGIEKYNDGLYLTLQVALREVVSGMEVDELLGARGGIGERLSEMTKEKIKSMGLELQSVDMKDLTLPGELKKIFSQVVTARKEGQAALEKARGETAALRNLANVAQLLERSPALLNLRVIQTLEGSKGNTVVMGPLPPGFMPLPGHPGKGEVRGQEAGGDDI